MLAQVGSLKPKAKIYILEICRGSWKNSVLLEEHQNEKNVKKISWGWNKMVYSVLSLHYFSSPESSKYWWIYSLVQETCISCLLLLFHIRRRRRKVWASNHQHADIRQFFIFLGNLKCCYCLVSQSLSEESSNKTSQLCLTQIRPCSKKQWELERYSSTPAATSATYVHHHGQCCPGGPCQIYNSQLFWWLKPCRE